MQVTSIMRNKLLWVVLLALVVRVLWVFVIAPHVPHALGGRVCPWDSAGEVSADFIQCYNTYAESMLQGNGFADAEGKPTAYVGPLYSVFLAGLYTVFGKSLEVIRIFQIILDTIACFLIFLIGRRAFSEKVGLLSACAYALYPMIFYQTGLVLTETLFTFLLILSMYLIVRAVDEDKIYMPILGGLVMGLAALTRPNPLLYPLFMLVAALVFVRKGKARLIKVAVLVAVGMALSVGPWVIRNYIHFKRIIPVSSIVFYTYADEGDGSIQTGVIDLAKKKIERITHNTDEVVDWALKAPYYVWYTTKTGIFDVYIAIIQYVVIIFAGIGIYAVFRSNRMALPLIFMLFYFVPSLLMVTKNAIARYTIPIMPFMIILAVVGVISLRKDEALYLKER